MTAARRSGAGDGVRREASGEAPCARGARA